MPSKQTSNSRRSDDASADTIDNPDQQVGSHDATPKSASTPTKSERLPISSLFSSSAIASIFMVAYMSLAMFNLYGLMYPLSRVKDPNLLQPHNLIHPLFEPEAKLAMKVYLSTMSRFQQDFFRSELKEEDGEETSQSSQPPQDTILLWKEPILSSASLSKSFLLSSLDYIHDEESCAATEDPSLKYATDWLNHQDHLLAAENEGLLSTIQSAAGQGIESTSILLTLYSSTQQKLTKLLQTVGLVEKEDETKSNQPITSRSNIYLPSNSPLWQSLQSNSTIYIHVTVVRERFYLENPETLNQAALTIGQASRSNSLLLGQVDLVKFDEPHHITKPGRILYKDLAYYFQKYILRQKNLVQPWDMAIMKPEYHEAHEIATQMKLSGSGYPYWKPEVSIKYLMDQDSYPQQLAQVSGMDIVRVDKKNKQHPTGMAFLPVLHVDEMGMTSDKYIPINETVTALPLRISFDRSDMIDDSHKATTATAGGISPARWRLLTHLSRSLESQRELGFEQSDIDDLRRLIADTNVVLLGITVLASALHLLFEFLTFKNEVSFWKNNSDLTGLSVRSLFLDMIGQFIIVLYLIEKDSSLLMTVPSAIGVLIALWKCQRAAGLAFVRVSTSDKNKSRAFYNIVPSLFGYELCATRLETKPKDESSEKNDNSADTHDLQALTIEADRQATSRLGTVLLPLVLGYTFYSLVMEEHISWYSWLITSASSAVYAFGFVLMTPQLFLNYKLKSVAHLPWRVLVYKSLNTFIDDLFSFIIRMPAMARISCFRDDVVFFIYLYQRWLYPVDTSRPIEGGGNGEEETSAGNQKGPTTTSVSSRKQTKKTGKTNHSGKAMATIHMIVLSIVFIMLLVIAPNVATADSIQQHQSVCVDVGKDSVRNMVCTDQVLETRQKIDGTSIDVGVTQRIDGSESEKKAIREVLKRMDQYFTTEVLALPEYEFARHRCKNSNELCAFWASMGECETNRIFMLSNCPAACQFCLLLYSGLSQK